ncbi:MAG: AzlC family ABC transporter permease [Anaerolineae bacterium]|nr:AzlC family ABC transporter permease [Anaerolineae bacterium]
MVTRRQEFLAGLRDTLPLVIGAVPFAIIFGALAVSNGISPIGAMGMSVFVFAGSAQFIAAGMVAQGVGVLVIIVTTLVVNLRHALYSATLAPHVKKLSQRWMLPLAFWLTDETFVVVVARYNKPDHSPYKHWYYFGSAVTMYINWQVWTLVGIVAGQSIPDMRSWGLDFALYVTFIGMLIPLIKNRPMVVATVAAGLSAVAFYNLPNKLGLFAAAVVGVIAGMIAEAMLPEKHHSPQPPLQSVEGEQNPHPPAASASPSHREGEQFSEKPMPAEVSHE